MKKTGRRWSHNCCPACRDQHISYSGKIDKNGIEYVVCGTTNKRCNIRNGWVSDDRRENVWCPYCVSFVCVCDEEVHEDDL